MRNTTSLIHKHAVTLFLKSTQYARQTLNVHVDSGLMGGMDIVIDCTKSY